jgi:SAM-dependent methyltransferase
MTDPTIPPGNVLLICWRQWWAERALARRGVRYRTTDPAAAAAAYGAMTEAEFEVSNGRQEWANWRTLPRALKGRVPDRPWRAIDLGCATGTSTRVLAACAPAGSVVTGYELTATLANIARRRTYAPGVNVRFVCQSMTEPLRDPDGQLLPDGSVDVVNSSGVVGHHLDSETVRPVVAEVRRVLVPGGLAVLDDGPTLPTAVLKERMRAAGFEFLGRYKCWPLATSAQVAFRAPKTGGGAG